MQTLLTIDGARIGVEWVRRLQLSGLLEILRFGPGQETWTGAHKSPTIPGQPASTAHLWFGSLLDKKEGLRHEKKCDIMTENISSLCRRCQSGLGGLDERRNCSAAVCSGLESLQPSRQTETKLQNAQEETKTDTEKKGSVRAADGIAHGRAHADAVEVQGLQVLEERGTILILGHGLLKSF